MGSETTGHLENPHCLMLDEHLPLKPGKVKILVFLPEETDNQLGAEQMACKEKLLEIARHCASLPVLDDRSPDEMLGYDGHGLPR